MCFEWHCGHWRWYVGHFLHQESNWNNLGVSPGKFRQGRHNFKVLQRKKLLVIEPRARDSCGKTSRFLCIRCGTWVAGWTDIHQGVWVYHNHVHVGSWSPRKYPLRISGDHEIHTHEGTLRDKRCAERARQLSLLLYCPSMLLTGALKFCQWLGTHSYRYSQYHALVKL